LVQTFDGFFHSKLDEGHTFYTRETDMSKLAIEFKQEDLNEDMPKFDEPIVLSDDD